MDDRLAIIMYHYVRDLKNSRYPNIKGLDTSQFRDQLLWLRDNLHAVFISCAQLLDALYNETMLPDNSVLLTFDDGYIDHYTVVFPLLKELGIPGFFSMPGKILAEGKVLDVNKIHFILASTPIEKLLYLVYQSLDYYRGSEYDIPDNMDLFNKLAHPNRFDSAEVVFVKRLLQVELEEGLRNMIVDGLFKTCIDLPEHMFAKELYMSMDQVKCMKHAGMEWGIHGYDHYWLNRLTHEGVEKDITRALAVFSSVIDKEAWICCYPYGSCDKDVICTASQMGAVAGFTTEVAFANIKGSQAFALPRLDTNDFPPKSEKYKLY